MKFQRIGWLLIGGLVFQGCTGPKKVTHSKVNVLNTVPTHKHPEASPLKVHPATTTTRMISMSKPIPVNPMEVLAFARRFLGTPYLYGSSNPDKGFDCSGFLYHVFLHFNIQAPRTSHAYAEVGRTISLSMAQPGDLLLFNSPESDKIGHIGLITEATHPLKFIHAASSRSGGVIISSLSGYYQTHFVKSIRIFQ